MGGLVYFNAVGFMQSRDFWGGGVSLVGCGIIIISTPFDFARILGDCYVVQ